MTDSLNYVIEKLNSQTELQSMSNSAIRKELNLNNDPDSILNVEEARWIVEKEREVIILPEDY